MCCAWFSVYTSKGFWGFVIAAFYGFYNRGVLGSQYIRPICGCCSRFRHMVVLVSVKLFYRLCPMFYLKNFELFYRLCPMFY